MTQKEALLDSLIEEMGVAETLKDKTFYLKAMVAPEKIAEAREMTPQEVREVYFRGTWRHIDNLVEEGGDMREALRSLAFGMLTTLEGAGTFCFCLVTPHPHPHNRLYQRVQGDNWFPQGGDPIFDGENHHDFIRLDPSRNPAEEERLAALREEEQIELEQVKQEHADRGRQEEKEEYEFSQLLEQLLEKHSWDDLMGLLKGLL